MPKIAATDSIVSVESVQTVACWTRIVQAMMLVSMVNAVTLAKEPWIVENMPSVKPLGIGLFVYVLKAMSGHQAVAKDVSKQDAAHILNAPVTNGVIRDDVKTLVPILELAESMHNAVFCTIKHCVLVRLDLLATLECNVQLMLMSVSPILVEPMLGIYSMPWFIVCS